VTVVERWAAYERAVQSVAHEVAFFDRVFSRRFGRKPRALREDFCGSAAVAAAFVDADEERRALGVDHDPGALEAARALNARERVELLEADARTPADFVADVVSAENFSYGVFHERDALLEYLLSAQGALDGEGVVVLDVLGGPRFMKPHADEHEGWRFEQETFDPITRRARFALWLGDERAFTYDWRLWSVPELVDAMREVGLAPEVYWQAEAGARAGIYRRRASAEPREDWVAYVVGALG
jgi:SAM-dependent methyltransferase